MGLTWPLLLPLLSSVIYVGGVLLLKRAADLGVRVWRVVFISNLAAAVAFLPLLLLGGEDQPRGMLWQPACVGLLLLLGQVSGFIALTRGDVSVATPVMGAKVILVAGFTTFLFNDRLPLALWLAAAVSALALALLGKRDPADRNRAGLTIACALIAAVAFALFDVLVQKWSPAWGTGRFLPFTMLLVALYSVILLPFFRAPLRTMPSSAWPWLISGSVLLALQSLLLIFTLAHFGQATLVNVVYNLRGLWSVLGVWLIGHWFHNREKQHGAAILRRRLLGAALMTAAILLAIGSTW
jgi:drug/metabolite transporter (DMT)-like permease